MCIVTLHPRGGMRVWELSNAIVSVPLTKHYTKHEQLSDGRLRFLTIFHNSYSGHIARYCQSIVSKFGLCQNTTNLKPYANTWYVRKKQTSCFVWVFLYMFFFRQMWWLLLAINLMWARMSKNSAFIISVACKPSPLKFWHGSVITPCLECIALTYWCTAQGPLVYINTEHHNDKTDLFGDVVFGCRLVCTHYTHVLQT